MKRILWLALLLLLSAIPAFAQQKQHNVTLYWQQPACPSGQACSATVSFNVYRSTLSSGPWLAAAQIGSISFNNSGPCPAESGLTGTCWTFVDTKAAGSVWYGVTAADAGGYESGVAVTAAAVTFPASPQAPSIPAAVAH